MHQLPEATCDRCAELTKAFEGRVAQMFATFRQTENIKTRRPKARKKTVRSRTKDGRDIDMPNDGMWGYLPTIKFKSPGFYRLNDYQFSEKYKWVGVTLGINKYRGPKDISIWKDFGSDTYSYEGKKFDVDSYALLMAKIAHCACVGEFGVDNFQHLLPPFILGEKQVSDGVGRKVSTFDVIRVALKHPTVDLAFFVGSIEEIKPPLLGSYYEIHADLQPYGKLGYIVYSAIRLFPLIGGPMALVVVGWVDKRNYQKVISYKNEQKGVRSGTG